MKTIIFSGTTEGRQMSERLSEAHIEHIVSVATEYGELVMRPTPYADIRRGRLSEEEMTAFISAEAYTVFDATHPYAVEVSGNIRRACKAAGAEYVRIRRNETAASGDAEIILFEDAVSCAAALKETEGNILLTTGSKELGIYAADSGVRSRLFARVLPSAESVTLCNYAGLKGRQIIAMQGPFTKETDKALMEQYDISIMVTKSSGKEGGFDEKTAAAAEAGVTVFMIGRPENDPAAEAVGVSEALFRYFGIGKKIRIDLVGTGPGSESLLTADACNAIKQADIICGAERMIREYSRREAYPYYLAKDIIPLIEERQPENLAILFSGDTGFYSGAGKMQPALSGWLEENGYEYEINVHPGISSVSYLAAKAGVAYQDAALCSMHGRTSDTDNLLSIIDTIRHNEKTFILMSGSDDVRILGSAMADGGLSGCGMILGRDLSYPSEIVGMITPADTAAIDDKGLYTAIVLNEKPESIAPAPADAEAEAMHEEPELIIKSSEVQADPHITKVISDDEFIRADVPMTKENIRHLSVLRLGLTEGAVVYDIGSGTGSVACEIAMQSSSLKVYAIEMKEEACSLIRQNAEKFGLSNIEVICGRAPEAFAGLEAPTHAFIGGSSGDLFAILATLNTAPDPIRVVINAVSLETMAEIQSVTSYFNVKDLSADQIAVSRSRELGSHHLMTAENPVLIASFTLGENK